LKARREAEMFELDYLRETREFTRLAMARITTWMESAKLVRKQITASMIQEEIVAAPDTGVRYRELMEQRQELHDIRDAMQQFANLWGDRRSSLQTQASLAKSKREVVLDTRK